LNPAAYRELVAELRHNLSPQADRPTPVFTFAYDWRLPLTRSVELLAEFIEEVIDRTRLLRHYDAAGWPGRPQVHLVAHSMGGLIAAGYLDRFGARQRVAKVASLATPFNGSFEAVLKIAVGTGDLGGDAPSSRERETARILPSLYHLVPAIPGSVQAEPGLSIDLFQPQAWQRRVVQTLAEFIRLHGLRTEAPDEQAVEFFASMLAEAQAYRRRVDELQLKAAGLKPADWLCVAGVNSSTRVRLTIRKRNGEPDFVLRSADRENRWMSGPCPGGRDLEQGLTGDGTVPFEGAVPKFLNRENVVCVAPQDFGYWEIGDRLLDRAAGFHAVLPNMNMLHRLIVRHFTNAPDPHGATWGRPAPGVPPESWLPPLPMLRNKDRDA
jgi:pimeloyl-ACP methyl ester carboxylesterase